MKQKLKKYLKEFILFVVLLMIASNALSYYRSIDLNGKQLHIKEVTLLDGSTYILKQDRPLLIHFWATWCPVCKLEAKNIQTIASKYEVLTIAVQSGSQEEIEAYMHQNNLDFKVVNDIEGSIAKQFNIQVFPTTFIYNRQKELYFSEVGYTSTLGLYLRMFFSS